MARKSKGKKSVKGPVSAASLPNAELDVLACLWREPEATARRIREMMMKYRPMAHGSVVTLLTRLENKALVSKKKGPVGKAFLFFAVRKAEPTQRELVKDMLQRVFAGDQGAMAAALKDVGKGK